MASDAVTSSSPVAPARRPRRWRRRVFWTLGILLLLVLLAPLALGLAPVRNLVAEKVGAALDRKVEIGSLSAFWFKGIDLEDIVVHSPDGFDGPLAKVARVHADVDVIGMLGGTVAARVRVVQPHVTLRRDAAGTSNVKDLGGTAEADRPEDEQPARLDIELVLVAGTVEALDGGGKAANALRDIQVRASLEPDGATDVELQALAEGAGNGGEDARLKFVFARDASKAGTYEVDIPALQLSRLARLAEDTAGVSDLTGTLEFHAEGTLHADDTIAGTWRTHLASVAAKTADGTQLSVHRTMGTAKLRSVGQATEADIQLGMGDLRVKRLVDGRVESFREPEISLRAVGRHAAADGTILVSTGSLQGGDLVQIHVKEPLRIESSARTRFSGRVEAQVSLGRLGSLRGLFPALEPLAAGTLRANITGSAQDAGDVGVGIAVSDLALRPSDLAPDGYSEPRMVSAFRVGSVEGGGTRVRLTQLAAQIVRLTAKDPARGITILLAPDGGYAVDGDFTLGVGLESLSRLMGRKLGLEAGERLGGTLQFVGSGRGTPEDMRLSMDVHGTRIAFPPSWGSTATPVAMTAKLVSTRKDGRASITLSDLAGMGLGGSGAAHLHEATDDAGASALAFREGELNLTVDLGRARPWLGGMLGMERGAEMEGRMRAELRATAAAGGHHVTGTTQVNDLYLRARPDLPPVREKRVTLHTDVQLADEGGKHVARDLKLDAAGLKLDLSGSTYVAEPDADVRVNAVVGGDAALLGPTLAALLGPDYADLRGTGRLSGSVRVTGSPAENGRALFANADLALGSWTTSGLNVERLLVRAERSTASAPLSVEMKAGLNGGSALARLSATLGRETIPWKSTVTLGGVDTSGLLVSQGAGRYLTFVMPALLPSNVEAPVLSGRLDAQLEGRSGALRGPLMKTGLEGTGRIAMEQGEIRQSTLFAGKQHPALDKVVGALYTMAPDVGSILIEMQKAITFSTLVSEFDVANQVVTVKQTKLTGKRAVIDMTGRVPFQGPVDIRSRVTLTGTGGKRLAKYIGQDALPLRVKGPLADPDVVPDVDFKKMISAGAKKGLLDEIEKKLPKLPKPPKLPNPFK